MIHAVGPAYGYSSNEFSQSDALLASAYVAAMQCASGVRSSTLAEAKCASDTSVTAPAMEYVGFSLLSAGIFRGTQKYKHRTPNSGLSLVVRLFVQDSSDSAQTVARRANVLCWMVTRLFCRWQVARRRSKDCNRGSVLFKLCWFERGTPGCLHAARTECSAPLSRGSAATTSPASTSPTGN